jgi:hypothetical protein
MKRLRYILCAMMLLALAGCGGGSSGSSNGTAKTNSAPTADAGADLTNVVTGSLVTLSGSGSDADGDTLSYDWAFTSAPSGSTAALSDPTVAQPTFTADKSGTYVLSLTVNDGKVNSAAATVTVVATSPTGGSDAGV